MITSIHLKHYQRLPDAFFARAGGCQNNSIKENQGIYGFIKDYPSLSRIEKRRKKHRVTIWAVTEPKSMNPQLNSNPNFVFKNI
jgi:hypothetical protein